MVSSATTKEQAFCNTSQGTSCICSCCMVQLCLDLKQLQQDCVTWNWQFFGNHAAEQQVEPEVSNNKVKWCQVQQQSNKHFVTHHKELPVSVLVAWSNCVLTWNNHNKTVCWLETADIVQKCTTRAKCRNWSQQQGEMVSSITTKQHTSWNSSKGTSHIWCVVRLCLDLKQSQQDCVLAWNCWHSSEMHHQSKM